MAKNISKIPTTISAMFKIFDIIDVLESEVEFTPLTVVDVVLVEFCEFVLLSFGVLFESFVVELLILFEVFELLTVEFVFVLLDKLAKLLSVKFKSNA